MEKEYKRNYYPLLAWFAIFIIGDVLLVRFIEPRFRLEISMVVFMNWLLIAIDLLMAVIHYTDNIYYINGVTFEKAKEAGIEKRKALSRMYLKHFSIYTLIGVIVNIFLMLFKVKGVIICLTSVAILLICVFSIADFNLEDPFDEV